MNNDPVDSCVREKLEEFNQKISDGTLWDEDPNWCSGGSSIKNTDKNLCCDASKCTSNQCGGIGNKFVDGQCEDPNNLIFPADEDECCGSDGAGCCKDGCCERDISANLCETTGQLDCMFNPDQDIFIVPQAPCADVVNALGFNDVFQAFYDDLIIFGSIVIENPLRAFLENSAAAVKDRTRQRLSDEFRCLYYSFYVNDLGSATDCTNLPESQVSECETACNIAYPSFDIEVSGKNEDGYYDFFYPVTLPRQDVKKSFFQKMLTKDIVLYPGTLFERRIKSRLDLSFFVSSVASNFTLEVFEEFMGCSVSVKVSFLGITICLLSKFYSTPYILSIPAKE